MLFVAHLCTPLVFQLGQDVLRWTYHRLKSTPHNAAPKEFERPGFPSLYREFISPRMNGRFGFLSYGSAARRRELFSNLATLAILDEWFIRVPCRVTPGTVAPFT